MALDRGMLAKIDRQVYAEFSDVTATQAVKVPLSEASWSTWRRYCQAVGLTMGEAVAGLVVHELWTVVGEPADSVSSVFAGRREEELGVRELRIAAWERAVAEIEERNRQEAKRLGIWDRDLQARERRLALATRRPPLTDANGGKVGRNERCPCGSGLKYKRCHGLTGHRT